MQGQPPCYSKLDNGSIIRIQWARRKGTRAHFVGYYGRSEARLRLVLCQERRKQAYSPFSIAPTVYSAVSLKRAI